MAHIFCITTGLRGIVNASLELVRRLESMGHQVTYLCPEPVEETVANHAYTYIQLPQVNFDPAPVPNFGKHSLARVKEAFYRFFKRHTLRKKGIEALALGFYQQLLTEQNPDLVVLDIELHDHILCTQGQGIPFLLFTQFFASRPQNKIPPIESTFQPFDGSAGQKNRIKKIWRKKNQKRWLSLFKQNLLTSGTNRLGILKAYAQQLNLNTQAWDLYAFPPPYSYNTYPVISGTLQELEFPGTLPANWHYVGPMVLEGRKEPESLAKNKESFQAFTKQVRLSGKPLVYCSISSMNRGDTAFLKKFCQAVSNREDWWVLLGLGNKVAPEELGKLPAHVLALPWIPQIEALSLAACSVNHGGIHTINECIHFGVPMLIYSGNVHDQNGNAARVEYHGVGLSGDRVHDQAKDITQKIAQLLTGGSFRERVVYMRDAYHRARSSNVLEGLIRSRLKAHE